MRNHQTISTAPAPEPAPFQIPSSNIEEFQFLHILTNTYFPTIIIIIPCSKCEKWYIIVVLICICLVIWFYMFVDHLCVFFREVSSCLVCFFVLCWVVEDVYTFRIVTPCQIYNLQTFFSHPMVAWSHCWSCALMHRYM